MRERERESERESTVCECVDLLLHRGSNFRKFVNFLAQLKQGEFEGLKVRVDRLQSLIKTSCIERLECGHWDEVDKQLQQRLM